jgi:hypothetical protein
VSADVIDLATARERRRIGHALPLPLDPPPTIDTARPGPGKRTGDRVRVIFNAETGLVIGFRAIRVFGGDVLCLLSVLMSSGTHIIPETEVVPAPRVVLGDEVSPPCDVGA